jgi:LuxR family maltose regulon positive regulatory protein
MVMKSLNLQVPVSKTKVIVPRRRDEIFSRPRLLDLLYDLLDKKLILISAPAGYGKTSLLIDLTYHSEMPFCWLALDELDRDPQRFIAYFIAALSERFDKVGGQANAVLNGLTSLDEDLERLVVTLVNEIYDHVKEHFVIILDDYHLVDDVPAIQNFLNRFIQLADENCHVIISSRVLINLPDLPLMVAHDQVGGLDFVELAFRTDEIQSLLAQNYHMALSDESARELAEETEGWITGLQLSSLGQTQDFTGRLRLARTSGVDIFDYLGQQVLDQQPEELRTFLLRSSLLGEFDAALCQSVLGPLYAKAPDWQGLINTVVQNNLFALPVGKEGRWLRYHHLFQEFLKARHWQERSDEVETILRNLAATSQDNGEWERAYYLYKQLGDTEALADMIERAGTPMLQSALITLENWLNNLPSSLVQTRPGLLSLQGGVYLMKGQVSEGLSLLNRADASFREDNDVQSLALNLVRRAVAHRYLGDYEASLKDAEEAIQLTKKDDALQSSYAEALRGKGMGLYSLGRFREAIEWLERSLTLCRNLKKTSLVPLLLMEVGIAAQSLGHYREASSSYRKALEIWQDEGNLTWQANVLNNLGVLYHSQGEYEKATLAFEGGLDCARKSGYARMEAFNLTSLGDLYAELEEYEPAWQAYQQAEVIAGRISDRFLLNYLPLVQADLARLQSDLKAAHHLLNSVHKQIQDGDSNYEQGLYNLEGGRLSLSGGDPQRAVGDLKIALRYFNQGESPSELRQAQLWLAAAYAQTSEKSKALEQLETALDLAKAGGGIHRLLPTVRQARPWLTNLIDGTEIGKRLKALYDQAEQFGSELAAERRRLRRLSSTLAMPDPKLTVQALGKAQVKVDGKMLNMSDWQTQSVRDLFFFFIGSYKPLTKEQVGLAAWPELEDPGRLKLRFKNDIYRLRRAVGQAAVIFENDHYCFNRELDYEYDVEAFETYLGQTSSVNDPEERIALYQKAVELVRGPYLADVDAGWVWPERQRLNQKYLEALMELAQLYLEGDQTEQALAACQHALEHDPCFEQAHQLLMRIYASLGDRPAVARQYQACKDSLQSQLDLPPSHETEALYRSLTD